MRFALIRTTAREIGDIVGLAGGGIGFIRV